jgi:hypothetical protein
MRSRAVFLAILFLSSLAGFGQDTLPSGEWTADEFNREVERFHNPDGGEYGEDGYALSRWLVHKPKLWFPVMHEQRDVFNNWLNGLSTHTFEALDTDDVSKLKALRGEMLTVCRSWSRDPKFGAMARTIAKKLKTLKISVVE